MFRKRILKIAGPSLLLLGSVMVFGAMRARIAPSTVDASPPYQSSTQDPTLDDAARGPLFNRSANEQRAAQTRILQDILQELRATRELLSNGGARVRVDSVEIDYERMASLLENSGVSHRGGSNQPEQDVSEGRDDGPSSTGTGSGTIRRISSVGSEQVIEE